MRPLTYRPELDGLRALAVIPILIYHLSKEWLPGGFVGVDVFFVISGFLITSIIVKQTDAGTFRLLQFYQRRIARILPAFLGMALATILFAALIYTPQDLALAGGYLAASALSLTNVKLSMQGSYFALQHDAHPFLHCWSLSVEEQFYIIFPVLVFLIRKRFRSRLFAIFATAATLSLVACIWFTRVEPLWAFYLLPTRAWEMLAGALIAVAGLDGRKWSQRLVSRDVVALLGLVIFVVSIFFTQEQNFPGYQALGPVLAAVFLIVGTGVNQTGFVTRRLASKPFVLVGKLSYSLYLWHWPIFALVDYHLAMEREISRMFWKVALTIVISLASYTYLENPARRDLGKPGRQKFAYLVLLFSIVLCVPLGLKVQERNYINLKSPENSPLVFNRNAKGGTLLLLGDSHGSMYGRTLLNFAEEHGYRLVVFSSSAYDALPPHGSFSGSILWPKSIATAQELQPDVIVLASAWMSYLDSDGQRLKKAVDTLLPTTKKLILVTQPPVLPDNSTREDLRKGARPPFFENSDHKKDRDRFNKQLRTIAGEKVHVIDLDEILANPIDEVPYFDSSGKYLYEDKSHLSDYGARLISTKLAVILAAGNAESDSND